MYLPKGWYRTNQSRFPQITRLGSSLTPPYKDAAVSSFTQSFTGTQVYT